MKAQGFVPALIVASAMALGLAACTTGGDRSGETDTGQPATSASQPETEIPAEAPETVPPLKVGPATLALTQHTFAREKNDLADVPGGTFEILTVNGKTAYRFENDESRPPKVNCNVDCPITWPPVLVDSAEVTPGEKVDEKLVGTVRRDDGHTQVTYNGWPLYWYQKDEATGDAKGEGLSNVWSTVKADGRPVFKKSKAPASGPQS